MCTRRGGSMTPSKITDACVYKKNPHLFALIVDCKKQNRIEFLSRPVPDQGSALRTSCRQGRDRFRPGGVPVPSEEPSGSFRFQPDQQGSPPDCGALATHGTRPSKVCRGAQEHQGFGGRGDCHHGLRSQRETKVSLMSTEKESHCQRLN